MANLSLIPEAAWREAQRRAEVIRPLAELDRRPRRLILAAAARLGLSERQTYTLIRRCMVHRLCFGVLLTAASHVSEGQRLQAAPDRAG